VASAGFRERIDRLRAAELVDYREVLRLKREPLGLLAAEFFERRPARFEDFERFLDAHPEVEEYAHFRAALDQRHSDWRSWPAALHGQIPEGEYNPADAIYHTYAQWIAAEQLHSLEKRADAAGAGLYLDLPVGVDPGGYDVWRRPDLYMATATTGAPPDTMFTGGQDWGLPPMHPERIREDGYQEFREVLAANMRYARYLRIDHAMGWHRLFVIPQGVDKSQGTYIRYHADEFYAVALLESHRRQCTLLAENLGTVPPEVNRRLERRCIGGMWILPYELEPSRRQGFNKPAELSVASLNTHDMPPAAAWWRGDDVGDRLELGLITAEEAEREREDRRQVTAQLKEQLRAAGSMPLDEGRQDVPIAALLRSVAASPAQLVPVNLEDLWLETRAQNVPGTHSERPNWLRKARYSLEEFSRMPEVLDLLDQINALRHRIEKPR
ncbi:MAG TPA: 4-alpha-glucanotransferase, partial [Lacipirellula sp.]